jgi:hypothetical protein
MHIWDIGPVPFSRIHELAEGDSNDPDFPNDRKQNPEKAIKGHSVADNGTA